MENICRGHRLGHFLDTLLQQERSNDLFVPYKFH